MRIVTKSRNKDEAVKDLQDLAGDVVGEVADFVSTIAVLQEQTARLFIEEYGERGPIDTASLNKMARIMSKYAASDEFRSLRKFPKHILKLFNTWQCLKKDAKDTIGRCTFAVIPAKLCFYYFYTGELCKAVVCLLDYVELIPEDFLAADAALRWLMFLGESELVEKKMNKWKMDKTSQETWETTRTAVSYMTQKNTRPQMLEKLVAIRDKLKKDNVKSFPKYELSSYVHWLCSTVSNVPMGSTMEECEFPDRLSQLQEAAAKADAIMRNRISGLAAYQFDNTSPTSIVQFLEGKRPGTAQDYLHFGSTMAWHSEMRREWALVNVTTAQGRDSMSAMILNLRTALKSASHFRIMQAANNITYFSMIIEEPGADENTKMMKASCLNMMSSEPLIVHCSTPIKNKEPARAQTPLPGRKSLKPSNQSNETLMNELVDKFDDLELINEQPFHPITRSCGCNVCSQYPYSSTFAAEYMFAYCIYSDFSQESMAHFNKEFVEIRERDMKCQAFMHRDASVRPRPNVIQNEVFGLCAIQWLIRKIAAKEPADKDSMDIYQNAMKIVRYLTCRMVDQTLAVQQLGRQLEFPLDKNYSWMKPISRKPLVRSGVSCAVDLFRTVSPFGRRPTIHVDTEKAVSPKQLEKIEKELRVDLSRYSHILYRDWRCRMYPYIGRFFADPWEAAHAWAESTLIGSRNAMQLKLERCRKGLVTISRPERFKACVTSMPDDMTLVQIAMADNKQIYLIKLHADREPIIMPLAHCSQATELMDKFTYLLEEDERIAKYPGDMTPKEFWEKRKNVDTRLESFVGEVQKQFLDVAAYLLMPSGRLGPTTNTLSEELLKATKGGLHIGESKEMVYLAQFMDQKSWLKLCSRFYEMHNIESKSVENISTYHSAALQALKKDGNISGSDPVTAKKYTYLVVCSQLSQFCWERLPIFEDFPYVGRQVSIHSTFSQLEALKNQNKQLPLQIDVQNAYYVLDPENNLGDTKKRMLEYINKFNWEGTVGEAPNSSDITNALQDCDAFFYFGHGSGSSVMPRSVIKQSTCNAISLLMGCGSVRTIPQAHGFDGKSALLDYAIAKCPLIVGCLWTVTDGEIDRFLMRMVDDCFERTRSVNGVDKLRQLAEAMHDSRSKAKLKYLTGAAVVMYGLPVVAKNTEAVLEAENQPVVLTEEFKTPKVVGKVEQRTDRILLTKQQETEPATLKATRTPPRTPRVASLPKTPRAICTRSNTEALAVMMEYSNSIDSTRVLRTRTPSRTRKN